MKTMRCLKSVCMLAVISVVASCATGNHLVFVKAKHIPTLSTVHTVAKISAPVIIIPTQTVPTIAAIPYTRNTIYNNSGVQHTARHHKALVHIMHYANTMFMAHAATDNPEDGTGGSLRTGWLLIILGLPMQVFWVAGFVGSLFTVMGIVMLVFGIVYVIRWSK